MNAPLDQLMQELAALVRGHNQQTHQPQQPLLFDPADLLAAAMVGRSGAGKTFTRRRPTPSEQLSSEQRAKLSLLAADAAPVKHGTEQEVANTQARQSPLLTRPPSICDARNLGRAPAPNVLVERLSISRTINQMLKRRQSIARTTINSDSYRLNYGEEFLRKSFLARAASVQIFLYLSGLRKYIHPSSYESGGAWFVDPYTRLIFRLPRTPQFLPDITNRLNDRGARFRMPMSHFGRTSPGARRPSSTKLNARQSRLLPTRKARFRLRRREFS